MSTLTLHSPPSPSAAAIGKKTRAEEQHTNGLQHEKEQRQVAKRHRKHIHHLKKAYAKQVSKNGNPPILFDILEMLGKEQVNGIVSRGEEFDKVAPFNEVVQVTIERLSAHGDGIARTAQGDRILAIPFTLPGEVVRVYPYGVERLYFKSRLVEIVSTESSMRRDDLVQCQYFGKCGGCQYQMVPYEQQLKLKQSVVRNAFAHYSGLDAKLMPPVLPTVASPATMQYRTKLTPHFNLPYSLRHRKKNEHVDAKTLDIPIGFDGATSGRVMDIEECPIGTPTINAALPAKQADVRERITDYKNGATLLLRDSLKDLEPETLQECKSVVVTDHKATVYELVGDIKFATPAGAFFQNNRSIIPLVVDYVKQQSFLQSNQTKPQYLVDTYCGSGLFALTLAGMFHQVAGVEISASSIECAKHNATLNQIENATFLAGNAENIFGSIAYPPSQTTVVIDPPRRGCDQAFIDQLVALKPRNIVIRGFDFFPQTHHVEV
ncbi:Trm2p [Malassezia vespertilionis]|uniref:Trm2p n=1 Tax=Malassezia vespertilionis TaxID=2020962 RepID=A0A2N1JCG6_9BASI|nr:Trm2p [Malassezia vespertilionis]